MKKSRTAIYQLKITLRGSKPPIWRRLEMESNTNLEDLHKIIQSSMGWHNGHLHQFVTGNEKIQRDNFGVFSYF